jgi:purine-binding chemotaxis protein CheW
MSPSSLHTGTVRTDAATLAGKYLTFRLAGEEFGLEIMKVQEIIGLLPVTRVPHLPSYMRGIVNLRGRIVPTIDLRAKFGLPPTSDTVKTCIIVVEVKSRGKMLSLGLIVDEVAEVLHIGAGDASPVAQFAGAIPMDFMLGVGVVNDAVKVLLDVDKVTTFEDVQAVMTAAGSQAAS